MALDTNTSNVTETGPSEVSGVCPFCAHVRSDSVGPCPKCTMEDTPTTRRSTGERIGPWYVLQKKNPTAPGLKFSVLIALIRRGHVTPSSIVRGPTTAQLWKQASQVKGLSRLFGLCWHCRSSVSPESTVCSRCKSAQDISGDPDAFIESLGTLPVMREIPSAVELNSVASEPSPAPVPEVELPVSGASPVSSADSYERPAAVSPRSSTETIMSARELAQVFQLDAKKPTFTQRLGRAIWFLFKAGVVLAIVGVAAGAAVMFFKPELAEQAKEFVKPYINSIRGGSTPSTLPATMPAFVPTTQQSGATSNLNPPTPTPTSIAAAPAPVATKQPEPTRVEPPKPPAADPVEVKPAKPAPASSEIMTMEEAVERGQILRRQAIEAEAKSDWFAAVYLYEQIEKLPKEARPTDLDSRLAAARARAAAKRD
jgi:hypothetical protein